MWGDDPNRKEPVIVSDRDPKAFPMRTWLLLLAAVMFALLAGFQWYFNDGGARTSTYRSVNTPPIMYQVLTTCTMDDNLSCFGSTISDDGISLMVQNTNDWDITEGEITMQSSVKECEFDGKQTLGLLAAGSINTYNFTCSMPGAFHELASTSNTIRVTYARDGTPVRQYASGEFNSTRVIVQ